MLHPTEVLAPIATLAGGMTGGTLIGKFLNRKVDASAAQANAARAEADASQPDFVTNQMFRNLNEAMNRDLARLHEEVATLRNDADIQRAAHEAQIANLQIEQAASIQAIKAGYEQQIQLLRREHEAQIVTLREWIDELKYQLDDQRRRIREAVTDDGGDATRALRSALIPRDDPPRKCRNG